MNNKTLIAVFGDRAAFELIQGELRFDSRIDLVRIDDEVELMSFGESKAKMLVIALQSGMKSKSLKMLVEFAEANRSSRVLFSGEEAGFQRKISCPNMVMFGGKVLMSDIKAEIDKIIGSVSNS